MRQTWISKTWISKTWIPVGFGALLCLGLLACEPQSGPPPEPVLAAWGGIELTRDLFVQEYRRYASTAPVRDDLTARRTYARQMLERLIIAEQGREAGLDTLPEVRAYVEREVGRAMRRVYLEHQIGRTLPEPSEADVREAFRRANTRLNLQQIYAATRPEADSLYRLLRQGVPFDTLAVASMRRYGVPDPEAAGRMGWVTWNDMDLAPESTAYALSPGDIAPPVASLQGWHIFRLLDREERVVLDASTYQNQRERLRFEWRQRRFDEAATRHIRDVLLAHELAVRPAMLQALWSAIAPYLPDRPASVALVADELARLAPPTVPRSIPVAYVDGRPFTAGQFLDALPDIPLAYWQPDLRPALEMAVRDAILTEQARAMRADTARSVRLERQRALYVARYYAALQAAADTLDPGRARRLAYERWRDTQFLDHTRTTYRSYRFADSTTAWAALRRYQQTADWSAALAAVSPPPVVETRTAVST
ncbi:MAG: hypothetical protein D6685_13500, partial [Bacteroidetes bacterium]